MVRKNEKYHPYILFWLFKPSTISKTIKYLREFLRTNKKTYRQSLIYGNNGVVLEVSEENTMI